MALNLARTDPRRDLALSAVAMLVAVVGGALGFFHGPAAVDGLVHFWTEWMFPAFVNIYLSGIALCA